jgi:hypothetical protein
MCHDCTPEFTTTVEAFLTVTDQAAPTAQEIAEVRKQVDVELLSSSRGKSVGELTNLYRCQTLLRALTASEDALKLAKAEGAVLLEAASQFIYAYERQRKDGHYMHHLEVRAKALLALCVAGASPLAQAFLAEHEAAMRNQRTVGTVEVCSRCYLFPNGYSADVTAKKPRGVPWEKCTTETCPLRSPTNV